jgi:GT2 family glycosyltransferase
MMKGSASKVTDHDVKDELPLVSVIVLNWNGEAIIGRCLKHLFAQTYSHFEIIVVDNGSRDKSLEILSQFGGRKELTIIKSTKNLGVAGGRNEGLSRAQGSIIAFMDNDGYADKNWVKESVNTLVSEKAVGAVSSLVFFAKKPIIMNGAGATIDMQGEGRDLCYDVPYEFATLPHEVLYPMGCGMVVRRNVLDAIGPLDPVPIKWFDDVELGIRIWKLGFRVVVSERALVDHDFNTSDQYLSKSIAKKIYIFERARIRNALKYFPLKHLRVWLLVELKRELRFLRQPGLRHLPIRFWAWNILHLPSALRWRFKFAFLRNDFWHLLDPRWGSFPPSPKNNSFHPALQELGRRVIFDGILDHGQLNFGWYDSEREGQVSFRWTEGYASTLFRFSSQMRSMTIRFRTQLVDRSIRVIVRKLGELESHAEVAIKTSSSEWQEERFPLYVDPGLYELLFITGDTVQGKSGRKLGLAVSFVEFSQEDLS